MLSERAKWLLAGNLHSNDTHYIESFGAPSDKLEYLVTYHEYRTTELRQAVCRYIATDSECSGGFMTTLTEACWVTRVVSWQPLVGTAGNWEGLGDGILLERCDDTTPAEPQSVECPLCLGTGELDDQICRRCDGSGELEDDPNYDPADDFYDDSEQPDFDNNHPDDPSSAAFEPTEAKQELAPIIICLSPETASMLLVLSEEVVELQAFGPHTEAFSALNQAIKREFKPSAEGQDFSTPTGDE